MAITTPAMDGMERIFLIDQAYAYANAALTAEGIDPLQAFVDTEVERHHYAVASGFQGDVMRLQTLASVAFYDSNFKTNLLEQTYATPEERAIARDFEEQHNKMHGRINHIGGYISELRLLGGLQ